MEIKDLQDFIEKLSKLDLKDRDLHVQYAVMKNAIKKLDERVEEIGGIILGEMKNVGELKKEFDFGKFTVVKKKSYTYSIAVQNLTDSVKTLKKKEEEEGIAEAKEKEYLLFS